MNGKTSEFGALGDLLLHQMFEAEVRRAPDAVALAFRNQELTYGELDRRANQLARHLKSMGVGPEMLVGISVERSFELVIGLLGILKAGGAYVPLDPDYPLKRLSFMMTDAKAEVLLTQKQLLDRLPRHHSRVLCLDSDWEVVAKQSEEKPEGRSTSGNLAYVIYTSGSTGKPKGAMNEHIGICNRLLWMQDEYGLTPSDTVLQKTPISFDVSVWELFWPLMAGARLVLAEPGGHRDAKHLVRLIEEERITILHFVPSMLHIFLDEPHLRTRCSSLRDVICSGEALSYHLQERFFSSLSARLHNLYGPTEAAVDVTYWRCRRDGKDRVVPIGYPVTNTQIHLLDERLKPVPVGEEGELFIGGVQVARGYWNRPELTAERFLPDPFREEPDARLYRTGDLARRRSDGAVEFLGRIDHQVKIRGNRIELGEIEAVLGQHASVKQAVVIAKVDESLNQQLVAYLVSTSSPPPTVSEVRRHLEEQLPDYMVPSAYVFLDEIPLSPNGKVDREALPPPAGGRPELDQDYLGPGDALEQMLTKIWRDVLGFDRVGVQDRFFELGGTSLQAAQIINGVQKELGEFIYVVTIFDCPTIEGYAAFLRRDYSEAVARRLGESEPSHPGTGVGAAMRSTRIDAAAVARMQLAIPVRPQAATDRVDSGEPRNPPALFILSPPRSGTTLLRVMLAGHPDLFAAAELQLLGFNTLQERRRAFSGKFSLWLEGTVRAVMEAKGCAAETAMQIMEDLEGKDLTTKQFYGLLQGWVGKRVLVDKSPAYALDRRALEKAEADFEDALYIHLVRHPYAMVRSFERYHMEQVLFLNQHSFLPRELAELVWTLSHRNTLEFLSLVPENRQHRVRFEDLVMHPRETMEKLCAGLGFKFHPSLVDPYSELEKKMTDGIHRDSTPMGDTRFLMRKTIDSKVAESWRGVVKDDFLGDVTWDLATAFGYDPPPSRESTSHATSRRRQFSNRQEKLREEREKRRGLSDGIEAGESADE